MMEFFCFNTFGTVIVIYKIKKRFYNNKVQL